MPSIEVEAEGYCGPEVTWQYGEGVLIISGTGEMTEFDNYPWEMYRESTEELYVLGQVTSIPARAFMQFCYLNNVYLCDSIETIGDFAFSMKDVWRTEDQYRIPSLEFPQNLKVIGNDAFCGCNLSTVDLPEGLEEIASGAFGDNEYLMKVNIPDSVTKVSYNSFYETGYAQYVLDVDEFVVINGILIRINTDEKDIVIPGDLGIKEINSDSDVLSNKSENHIESIIIPDGVEIIGGFGGCKSLTKVIIPDSVTTIGNRAFKGCESLTEVNIPDSVITIGNLAFEDCTSLKEINLPNSLVTIGKSVFEGCESLTEVDIPESVMEIGKYAFEGVAHIYYYGNDENAPFGAKSMN